MTAGSSFFLAADLLYGVRLGHLDRDRSRLIGFQSRQLLVEIDHIDPADAPRPGADLRVVLMRDDLVAEFHVDVAVQQILRLDAAIFDRHQRALLLTQIGHRLLDVVVGHVDLWLFHLQIGHGELWLHLDLKSIVERAAFFRELDRFGIVKFRLADDLQIIFLHRLAVALADQCAANLLFHIAAESFLDQLGRGVADAEAGDVGLLTKLFKLLGEFGFNAIAGDFDADLLGSGAGVFDFDGVLINFFSRLGGCDSGFVL